MSLARFRADPRRVRIGVRRHGDLWYVRIGRLSTVTFGWIFSVERMHRSPTRALVLALRAAEALQIPGVDLGMQWAYEHPQHPGRES